MKPEESHLELKVGVFVLTGLLIAGGMVVQFGRFAEGMTGSYEITVRFPDASGLTKGAEVLMNGARIGRVADNPRLLADSDGVVVPLRIGSHYKIPADAVFRVGSSGLLGDRFVQILRKPAPPEEAGYLEPGAAMSGVREPGVDDFVRHSEAILDETRALLASLRASSEKVQTGLLTDDNMRRTSETLKALSESAGRMAALADKAERLLDELAAAGGDARRAASSAAAVAERARAGEGLLAALLSDKKLADDVRSLAADARAFAANLRARGVLFYRDRAAGENAPAPRPAERRQGR